MKAERKVSPATCTISLVVSPREVSAIQAAAERDALSSSKWIAIKVRDALARGDVHMAGICKTWVPRIAGRSDMPDFQARETRISSVIRETDRDAIGVAVKRFGVSTHAFIQALAIIMSEEPALDRAATAPVVSATPVEASDDHLALIMVCKTLSAFLIRPDRADDLAGKLRRLSGVPEGERLSSAHIMAAALKGVQQATPALDKRTPERGNVVVLADAVTQLEPRAKITTKTGFVQDQFGNKATFKTFGSREAAVAALDSLKDCVGCEDCVECNGCRNCSKCGRCVDCVGCNACVGCKKCVACKSCEHMANVTGFDGASAG